MVKCESLQSLCLKSVVDNISRFCAAYRNEQYEELQYYLEFIQRRYANDLWKVLSSRRYLENEHINFVINKYVTELDFRIFQGSCDYLLVIEQLKNVGNAITKMSLSGEKNYQTINKVIGCLSLVEVLELRNTKGSDETLLIIAESCPNIKSLDVKGCARVSDRGLPYLKECRFLECLNVEDTSSSYRGIAILLKGIPTLQTLHHENVSLAILDAVGLNSAVKDGSEFKGTFNLTSLYISNNPMRPQSHLTLTLEVCTSYCPKVKDLKVFDLVTKEQLQLCCLFRDLEAVSFGCSFLAENDSINDFLVMHGVNLKILRLTSFSMSIELLAQCCPNLECLSLENPTYQPISEECMKIITFPKLKMLHLKKVVENFNVVSLLISASPNLEVFTFCRSYLSEVIQAAVSNTTAKLKVINLNGTYADMGYLQHLLRTHSFLEKLIIYNTNITAAQYDDLLDYADELQSEVDIMWSDFSDLFRSFFSDDNSVRRQVIKL